MEIGARNVFLLGIAVWHKKASFVMNVSISRNAQVAPGATIALIASVSIYPVIAAAARIVLDASDFATNNTTGLTKI